MVDRAGGDHRDAGDDEDAETVGQELFFDQSLPCFSLSTLHNSHIDINLMLVLSTYYLNLGHLPLCLVL